MLKKIDIPSGNAVENKIVATDRVIFSLIENFQQADGSIVLPKILAYFMGKKVIKL